MTGLTVNKTLTMVRVCLCFLQCLCKPWLSHPLTALTRALTPECHSSTPNATDNTTSEGSDAERNAKSSSDDQSLGYSEAQETEANDGSNGAVKTNPAHGTEGGRDSDADDSTESDSEDQMGEDDEESQLSYMFTVQEREVIKFLSLVERGEGMSTAKAEDFLTYIKTFKDERAQLLPKKMKTCWRRVDKVAFHCYYYLAFCLLIYRLSELQFHAHFALTHDCLCCLVTYDTTRCTLDCLALRNGALQRTMFLRMYKRSCRKPYPSSNLNLETL